MLTCSVLFVASGLLGWLVGRTLARLDRDRPTEPTDQPARVPTSREVPSGGVDWCRPHGSDTSPSKGPFPRIFASDKSCAHDFVTAMSDGPVACHHCEQTWKDTLEWFNRPRADRPFPGNIRPGKSCPLCGAKLKPIGYDLYDCWNCGIRTSESGLNIS